MLRTASGSDGWTLAEGPVLNEMLLHDVYDVPYDVLRSALKAGPLVAACPCCCGTGVDYDSIRHARDCSFIASHL